MAKLLKHHEMFNYHFDEQKLHSIGYKSMGLLVLAFSLTGYFLPAPVRIAAALIGISFFLRGRQSIQEGLEHLEAVVEEKSISDAMASLPMAWSLINDLAVGKSKIDHIVVCPKGVFAIKTKNYSGTIDGNLDERTWCQISADGARSIFFNPVKEARGQSVELQRVLQQAGFQDVKVHPVAVFTKPTVRLRVSSPKVPVIRMAELSDSLRQQPHVMMPEKCAEIAKFLDSLVSRQNSKRKLARKSDSREENGMGQAKKNDPVLQVATFEGFAMNSKRQQT